MNFKDMNLQSNLEVQTIRIIDDLKLEVRDYLPIAEKTQFIQFVVNGALDENTGCFSPVRTYVYFAIALCKWYGNIEFDEEDLKNIEHTFDTLYTNLVIENISDAIDPIELNLTKKLVNDTIDDISRYNSSAAGIVRFMSTDAGNLDNQIGDILEKIKNREGLETLDDIKAVVGKD